MSAKLPEAMFPVLCAMVAACFVLASLANTASAADDGTWFPDHPGMYGGDVPSLAFSPQYAVDATIYAGTYGGGVFRSSNRGQHWLAVNQGLPDWIVTDIALSPDFSDDHTLYVATGALLYKSINGGDAWTEASLGIKEVDWGITALAISPNNRNDQTLFASTDSGGIFRSVNNAGNWNPASIGLTDLHITDLAISPGFQHDTTVFAATANGGIFRTSNGGNSWYAINGGLTTSDTVALAISPFFVDDHVVFAATQSSGIYRSDDRGNTWLPINSQLPELDVKGIVLSPDFGEDQTLFAILDDQGIVKSTSGGQSWQAVNAGLGSMYTGAVALSPAFPQDGTVLVGMVEGGGLYKSVNRGSTWTSTTIGLTAVWVTDLAAASTQVQNSLLFAASYGSGMFRSRDLGGSWEAINSGLTDRYIHKLSVSPDFTADQTIFAGTYSNGIFRTVNGGTTWLNIGPTNSNILEITPSPDFGSDRTLYVATEVGIFKSVTQGDFWTASNAGLPADNGEPLPVLALAVSPKFAVDQTVFAGTDAHGIYKTTDGGALWSPIGSSLVTATISALAVSPKYEQDGTLYAVVFHSASFSTDVYRSTDWGANWLPADANLPGAPVTQIKFSPTYADDNTIYASTHFDGVYYSQANGPWQRIDPGLGQDVHNVQSLLIVQAEARFIFGGTRGSGVWSYVDQINPIEIDPQLPPGECDVPSWNVLVYLNGDNNLDFWTADLFNELELAASNQCIRILTLWDRSAVDDTVLYWVQPDTNPSRLANYTDGLNRWPQGEQNMGNPQTLVRFVLQMRTSFTATHSLLAIVDHGNGWSPSIPPGPVKYVHGGMSFDDSGGGAYLSTESLAGALDTATDAGAEPIDVVFFDACLMGMAENLHPLTAAVGFLVASQNETFSRYPYAAYLNDIGAGTQPRDVAVHIVERYHDSLAGFPRTMTAYDLTKMASVSAAIDEFAQELVRITAGQRGQIMASYAETQRFDADSNLLITTEDTFVDLYDFAQHIIQNVADPAVQAAAEQVMSLVAGAGSPLVIQERHSSGPYWGNSQHWNLDDAHGLSIYLPLGKDDVLLRYYNDRELSFARDTAWDEFLRTMMPPVQGSNDVLTPLPDGNRPGPLALFRYFLPVVRY